MTITKRIFQSPKNRIFYSKGLTHAFGQKMPIFLYLNLIKLSLEIMLSDVAEKEKPCLALKNRIFQSSKKRTFSEGFGQKNAIFKIYSDLVKIRVEIMLKLH